MKFWSVKERYIAVIELIKAGLYDERNIYSMKERAPCRNPQKSIEEISDACPMVLTSWDPLGGTLGEIRSSVSEDDLMLSS
jgi:hypothetical protein